MSSFILFAVVQTFFNFVFFIALGLLFRSFLDIREINRSTAELLNDLLDTMKDIFSDTERLAKQVIRIQDQIINEKKTKKNGKK